MAEIVGHGTPLAKADPFDRAIAEGRAMAEEKRYSPLKAIRLKCMDCSNQQYKEVELCPCTDCPIYPFRFGHNPNRKGVGNKNATFKNGTNSGDDLDGFMNTPEE